MNDLHNKYKIRIIFDILLFFNCSHSFLIHLPKNNPRFRKIGIALYSIFQYLQLIVLIHCNNCIRNNVK